MIKFENTEVMGWEHAIRGMRNPMNSWEKSDSEKGCSIDFVNRICKTCDKMLACNVVFRKFVIGPNDLDLMKHLRNAGTDHRKFMRMIVVYVDITAPLYWWKEFDTYKVGTVANSCSTMHKIAAKEFTLEDFSCEHLVNIYTLQQVIKDINFWRGAYLISDEYERMKYIRSRFDLEKVDPLTSRKDCWRQMIQLLPSSYNQKRTVMMNYEVLTNIYESRKNHKLDEWSEHSLKVREHPRTAEEFKKRKSEPLCTPEFVREYVGFCDWIKTLPYSELITGEPQMIDDCSKPDSDKFLIRAR